MARTKRIPFWQTLFSDDLGWTEASAINEAHDAIDILQSSQVATSQNFNTQMRKLFALDRVQAQQLSRLAITIDVLTELLLENDAISKAALSERVLGRVKEVESAEAEEVRRGPMVTCGRCARPVPAAATQITDAGTVCDRCYYQRR